MLRPFLLPLLLTGTTAWTYLSVGHPSKNLPTNEVLMSSNSVVVKAVRLIAREQRKPLIGQLSTSNRDIGFATVFLTIENLTQEDANLVIERIQIEDARSANVQMENQNQMEVRLKPLENSVNDFHLINRVGYSTQNCVKAIVTYRIGQEIHVVSSDPVEVEHN